jgi:hypothetical protein
VSDDNCPYVCQNADGNYKRGYSKKRVKRVSRTMQAGAGGAIGFYHCPCRGWWHVKTVR